MANLLPGQFHNYENERFNSSLSAPVSGTKSAEGGADALVRAIITRIARDSDGIAECIERALELDPSDYSIYFSGSPVHLNRLDGESIGYSITVSIYKALDPPKPKSVRRVAKLPRAKY